MSFNWIIVTLVFISLNLISTYQDQSVRLSDAATLDSLSRNLLVYRSAAAEYAKSNPVFVGAPADAVLDLPDWFSKPSGVSAYISDGQSYTYFSGSAPPGLPAQLVERTQSVSVGTNRSGILISPIVGSTGILLPAAIPEGAIVAVN